MGTAIATLAWKVAKNLFIPNHGLRYCFAPPSGQNLQGHF